MSFGYDQQRKAYIGDTVVLDAYLHERDSDTLVSFVDLNTVAFTIRKPSDTTVPTINAQPGVIIVDEDGHGQFIVSDTVTTEAGEYKGYARFTLADGRKESVVVDFDIIDPFQSTSSTPLDIVLDRCWTKLEDCFDSEMGNAGPWLRDMTLAKFDQTKMHALLPEALLEINTWQPPTQFDENSFPYTDVNANAVLVEALLLSSIRHLMRSYTEQPDVTNSNVGFLDRKRYADAWGKQLQIEQEWFRRVLTMWKRTMFGFGRPATLVSSKAGRILSAPMRTRYSGRGFY